MMTSSTQLFREPFGQGQRGLLLVRAAAAALAVSGIFFILYPTIRPFSDETSLEGAAAFASSSWVVAHSLGMGAFALLMLGFIGLHKRLEENDRASGTASIALVLTCVGILLTLPFYGAETFGLYAIGQDALERSDEAVMTLADSVRSGPGIAFLGLGLASLALGGVLFATAIWRSGHLPRLSGIALALALVLYLPQFVAPEAVRVAHGLLMMGGCFYLGYVLIKAPELKKIAEGPETN